MHASPKIKPGTSEDPEEIFELLDQLGKVYLNIKTANYD